MSNDKQVKARRTVLAGAAGAGALATAATLLPTAAKAPAGASGAKPADDSAAGYRMTEHVKRYYQTARI